MSKEPEPQRPLASSEAGLPEAGLSEASLFEVGLEELEKVVKELESGDLPLERALALFERGVELSNACRKQLEEAETRVEMLLKKDGKIQPEPFRPDKA
jgi:exodeoxyribonuclease VII small subunit